MTVSGWRKRCWDCDGFRVLEVTESVDELVVTVETVAELAGCAACGTRAEAHERRPVEIRDLAVLRSAGAVGVAQAAVALPRSVCVTRRRGRERSEHVDAQAVITRRAGMEACRQVGETRPAGVGGRRRVRGVLVDGHERGDRARHPARRRPRAGRPGRVSSGSTRPRSCAPTGAHPTMYATGLVDLAGTHRDRHGQGQRGS